MNKPKVIAIVGPTSSGKTALGVWLAKQIKKDSCGAEIISADSRQVYKGLNIGTGKVTKKEMSGIPHYLLDVASPKQQFNVDDFVKKANESMRGMIYHTPPITPIVVGGTGFYIDTLLGRMKIAGVPPNQKLRDQLEQRTTKQLFAQLKKLDPARAKTIEPKHKRRLIRAIEIAKGTPSKIIQPVSYTVLWLGLNPGEEILRKKIRTRLLARIKSGMIAEAKKLHSKGLSYKRMEALGLEYRFMARLLQNKISKQDFETQLEREINNYAKRQMRWFKRNPEIQWVTSKSEALQLARQFLTT